jgi:hypothetical protein
MKWKVAAAQRQSNQSAVPLSTIVENSSNEIEELEESERDMDEGGGDSNNTGHEIDGLNGVNGKRKMGGSMSLPAPKRGSVMSDQNELDIDA